MTDDDLDGYELGSLGLRAPAARGAPRAKLFYTYERDLDEGDIATLIENPSREVSTPSIQKLKQSHHTLARLLAEGTTQVEAAAITGYSLSRISVLKLDPAFCELMEYYSTQQKEIYLNVHQRLASLGLDALEELHDRLNDPSQTPMSNKELQDLVALSFDRAGYGPRSTKVNEFKFSLDGLLDAVKEEVTGRQLGQIKTLDQVPRKGQLDDSSQAVDTGEHSPKHQEPIHGEALGRQAESHSNKPGQGREGDGSAVREPGGEETPLPANQNLPGDGA